MIRINRSEVLVPIAESDLEFLRRAKNSNRDSFFHKTVITRSDQKEWFSRYQGNRMEHMFIVCSKSKRVGILGLRLRGGGKAELYNVIRVVERTPETQGLMSRALDSLIRSYSMTHGIVEFIALVVPANEAMGWYLRNGFQVLSEDQKAVKMGLRNATQPGST